MSDVIILAGGRGTRLSSVVGDRPKPMALINGVPFLEILVRMLEKQGVRRIIISTGYMGSLIRSHFQAFNTSCNLTFSHEDQPLGTGGAIRLAFAKVASESAVVINGDTYLDLNFQEMNKFQRKCGLDLMMVGVEVNDSSRYGAVRTENGVPFGFIEKGVNGRGIINGGVYWLPKNEILSHPMKLPFSFEDHFLIPKVNSRSVALFEHRGSFIDIGVPEDYARAQTLLRGLT